MAEVVVSEDHGGTRRDLETIAECAVLCNNASIEVSSGRLRGQPTEGALLALAGKLSTKRFEDGVVRVKEVPFCSETKVMEVVCSGVGGSGGKITFLKGALEVVLGRCDSFLKHGQVLPLAPSEVPAVSVRMCAE